VRVLEFKEILLLLKKLRLKCGSSFLIPAPGICQTIEPEEVLLELPLSEPVLRKGKEMQDSKTNHLHVVSPALVSTFMSPGRCIVERSLKLLVLLNRDVLAIFHEFSL